jgi:hypothetical protein
VSPAEEGPSWQDQPPLGGQRPTGSAAFTAINPTRLIAIGVGLTLLSCVLIAADLPGVLNLLLICLGPIGMVIAIAGFVLLMTRRANRTF